MLLPLAIDAPMNHRPIATIGLIAVNTAIFFLAGHPVAGMLSLGNGWQPWEWVTADFLHADVLHLVGNMIFLWSFGMVVEGQIGWWRFLSIYWLIAVSQNVAAEMMFGSTNGPIRYALGASGTINGLMAIALLWAPCSEFTFARAHRWGWTLGVEEDEISVMSFTLWLIGWDFVVAYLTSFALSTPMLHLTGAAMGFLVGLAFLQWKWVDCDQLDAFTLLTGRGGRPWKQLQSLWKSQTRRSSRSSSARERRAALPEVRSPQMQPSDGLPAQRKKRKSADERP